MRLRILLIVVCISGLLMGLLVLGSRARRHYLQCRQMAGLMAVLAVETLELRDSVLATARGAERLVTNGLHSEIPELQAGPDEIAQRRKSSQVSRRRADRALREFDYYRKAEWTYQSAAWRPWSPIPKVGDPPP